MDNRVLDHETKAKRPVFGSLELLLLVSLTAAPLLQMFGMVGNPGETRAGTVYWCIWVGTASVLPWRFVRRGRYRLWALILAVLASLLLLWTLGLVGYGLIRHIVSL
jgi:hypothetical protein